jgi:hypothetical protein
MASQDTSHNDDARFELRYQSLSTHRCGYAFPRDSRGRVSLDQLSERARANYLYARAIVGLDLRHPQVLLAH